MTDSPAAKATRRPSVVAAKRLLVASVALVVAGAGFVGVGAMANEIFLWPETDRGKCFVFDPDWCTELTLARVESESGIVVPPETVIVESGSAKSLRSGHVTAILELPEGYTPTFSPDFEIDSEIDRSARKALARHGVLTITDARRNELGGGRNRAIVVSGVDGDGDHWAYVQAIWNG